MKTYEEHIRAWGDWRLPFDPGVRYVGWTEHRHDSRSGSPTSTRYAVRVPAEHAEAWRTHLDKKNLEAWERNTPGMLYPDQRKHYTVHERWANNGTVMHAHDGPP